jgi:hypothetical protein
MHSKLTPSAVSDLAALVSSNALASRYELYIERHIRNGDSFYASILAKQGQEAADAALVSFNRRGRISDYAAAAAPVARGLLALSLASSNCVQAVDDVDNAEGKQFVMLNQVAKRSSSVSLPGEDDWGPFGRLGLKAVKLKAGLNHEQEVFAELGLVALAPRRRKFESRWLRHRQHRPERLHQHAQQSAGIHHERLSAVRIGPGWR